MLLQNFFLENLHFSINVFAALVFFSVSWLYLDAWLQTKSKKELFKVAGFILLSVSFLANSTQIQQVTLIDSLFNSGLIEGISNVTKFLGLILLIVGLFIDPIQKKPVYSPEDSEAPSLEGQMEQASSEKSLTSEHNPGNAGGNPYSNPSHSEKYLSVGFLSLPKATGLAWYVLSPALVFIVFILLLRRSTIGLEKHLRPLTAGFFFIFLYELLSVSGFFQDTSAISIYKIIKPLGPVWILEQILLLVGVIIIGKWVFGYLLRRLQTQFFMILNLIILVIFLVTTMAFSTILLRSLQQNALSHLTADIKLVQYGISAKKEGTLSDAELVSQNPELILALTALDTQKLKQIATSTLIAKNQAYLIILNKDGQVLARGENSEKSGDSLSSSSLFQKAKRGEKVTSVVSKDGVISPTVSITSAVPLVSDGGVIGIVIVGTDIDNAFVDGLKSSTGLDVSIYGGNVLAATSFIGSDGKSRFLGVKEENDSINKKVLNEGEIYSGELDILSLPYFVSFAPLKDDSGNNIGMLFAGKEQQSVISIASKAVEYTFLISALLILLSIIPSFFISRFITNQFK